MLLWLIHSLAPLLEKLELISSAERRAFLTTRTALASLTSFLIAICLGPFAIRWLKSRFRERIASDSARLNELHAGKSSTPTMGGLLILGSLLTAILLWCDLTNRYVQVAIFTIVGFGTLGAGDDWIKLRTTRKGLSVREKLIGQILLGGCVSTVLFIHQYSVPHGLELTLPFLSQPISLGWAFIPWSTLVIVALSNAVNLTDGLDGLAGGCMVFTGSAAVALTYLAGHRVLAEYLRIPYLPGCGEFSVVLGATVGAVLGFLWFNCHPAQVFMGDTGSLPLGSLLAVGAIATRQELLIGIASGVFIVETLSVICQVGWFKLTRKRLIACSPLHNHYLFRGQHETKIVIRFWIVAALLAIVSVALVKLH